MPRNGLGRARRVEATPVIEPGFDLPGQLLTAATIVLAPPRRAAAVALGGSTLLARGVALVLGAAADEGERQLNLVGLSLRNVAARWWG